jgi:hypothetical protein
VIRWQGDSWFFEADKTDVTESLKCEEILEVQISRGSKDGALCSWSSSWRLCVVRRARRWVRRSSGLRGSDQFNLCFAASPTFRKLPRDAQVLDAQLK